MIRMDWNCTQGRWKVNRATNFKVIAVKDHMQNSKVLTVGYTVRKPEVIVEAETEETTVDQGDNGRLMSRRSYSDTESGPSYTDVVLKNATYGVVVASEEGTIPDNVQLESGSGENHRYFRADGKTDAQ